jgi:tryptophanyl-tRNA synthetase
VYWHFFITQMSEKVTEKLDNLTLATETAAPSTAEVAAASAEQSVTPWDVEGAVVDGVAQAIDYNKLIEQFGTKPIDDETLQRLEKLTGRKPHIFLRRGIFFSHRYGQSLWLGTCTPVMLAPLTCIITEN